VQRIRLIYEQLEEAKAYLLRGSLFNLRLAVILADNTAELLVYSTLQRTFDRDDWLRPLRKNCELAGRPIDSAIALKYSEEERAKAEKEFEPMVQLAQHKLRLISGSDATILRIAHRLRRDAFHRGQIRQDILGPIVRLLFATVVGLAQSVHFTDLVQTFPPADGDEAFLERFGMAVRTFWCGDDYNGKLGAVLLKDAEFNFDEFRTVLTNDLLGRVEAAINQVTYFFKEDEQNEALLRRQFTVGIPVEVRVAIRDSKKHVQELDRQFDIWRKTAVPLVTREWLLRFRDAIARKLNSRQPAQVLATYWGLDKKFSPIESFINDYVAAIDSAIQMEIDIARGK
jgi:hypothetical protein